ncbi:hypothetical protein HD553DRAFT_347840 [Filobasidium floriforme]|uniref:uncharacterized protein n=1 Tax=Filobasidium floriforme TaxID=5210 RepID=UPI001E8DD843|nr:uncharacterized protein HD553DRAFT_347840 [Filobasidium floriforme]KAH8089044.1 hypothetical protein HD553DRAFT_347840 [Filobasidium floriforme]
MPRFLPSRYSPIVQILILSVIAALAEGAFIAASSIGSGGTSSLHHYNISRALLNGAQALFGPFAGGVVNWIGIRPGLFIGGCSMVLLIGSFWQYNVSKNTTFMYIVSYATGTLGCLFWTSWASNLGEGGSLLVGLPSEKDKGRATSIAWGMIQLGVIGCSAILVGVSNTKGDAVGFPNSVQLALIIVVSCSLGLILLIVPFDKVVRTDGTKVIIPKKPALKDEVKGLWRVMRDWRIFCLTPANFLCLQYMVYHSAINTVQFTGRTGALASLVAGVGSASGGFITGHLLDRKNLSRRKCGIVGLVFVSAIMWITWIGGVVNQTKFERHNPGPAIDWTDSRAGPQLAFRLALGLADGSLRNLTLWTIGTLSNDPSTGARYSSIWLSTLGGGAAFFHILDGYEVSLLVEASLLLGQSVLCVPLLAVVLWSIPDVTVERLEKEKTTEGSLEFGNHLPSEDT